MERKVAERLVAEYLNFGDVFNRISEISYQIADSDSRRSIRGAAAEAQFQMYEIVRTVVKEYPNLAPHEDKESS